MDNQNMTYPELRDLFVEHNKTQLAKPVSACIVFAESNWPDHHYPLRSRTYEVSSDNKAFRPSCCSTICSVPAWMAPTRWFASTGT